MIERQKLLDSVVQLFGITEQDAVNEYRMNDVLKNAPNDKVKTLAEDVIGMKPSANAPNKWLYNGHFYWISSLSRFVANHLK